MGYSCVKFKKVLLNSFTSTPNLEMLSKREQLMWDIDGIVEEFFVSTWGDEYGEEMEQMIRVLCDAVCKNFPAK
jgi:hypothetical protein